MTVVKGSTVELDGLDDGTLWPEGEFEVVSDVFGQSGKNRAMFDGLGYAHVHPTDDRWDGRFLVVPVKHLKEKE